MYEFDNFEGRGRRSGRGWMYTSIILICLLIGGVAAAFVLLGVPNALLYTGTNLTPIPTEAHAAETPKPAATEAAIATPVPAASHEPPVIGASNPVIASIVDGNPIPEIYKRVNTSVVGVVNKVKHFSNRERSMQEDSYSSASGIIITQDGYIVTNAHVVEGGSAFTVILSDGEEWPAELVGSDAATDIAVLKIDKKELSAAALGDSEATEIGEVVITIGNPAGPELGGTVTMGIISGKNRVMNLENVRYSLLQTDAAINPGSSGGPLLNLKGEVIGINTLKTINTSGIATEGLGFAIPINDARPIIQALMQYGHIKRPALGISGMTIDEFIAEIYGLPQGVFVEDVFDGSPAEEAGMQEEDIIIAVDGVDVRMFADLIETLEKHAVGDTVEVRVYRDSVNEEITMKITLYDIPE